MSSIEKRLLSIVVPIYNRADAVTKLVADLKIYHEIIGTSEIIIINDGSTDGTSQVLYDASQDCPTDFHIVNLQVNQGPGIARNIGIQKSKGDWILFLDSDDYLNVESLVRLKQSLQKEQAEILFVDFSIEKKSEQIQELELPRRDKSFLTQGPEDWLRGLKNWLVFHECMFAVYKRQFLIDNNIEFRSGYYEDIVFGFQCATSVQSISFFNDKVYRKCKTPLSITQTMSEKHVSDYIRVLLDVDSILKQHHYLKNHNRDTTTINWLTAIISRIQSIIDFSDSDDSCSNYLENFLSHIRLTGLDQKLHAQAVIKSHREKTVYEMIANKLFTFSWEDRNELKEFIKFFRERISKKWSCIDIQESVFFAPNEIRTCCKRFFVDGEIKGDVVLNIGFDMAKDTAANRKTIVSAVSIFEAKRNLERSINTGLGNPCRLCPFLKFQSWNDLESNAQVKYVSMEQHSVCNLRCTYCDDKYYGGKLPDYDILGSIQSLKDVGAMEDLRTVVWGGGEPTLERSFDELLKSLKSNSINCEHRFLTNSLRFSSTVAETLKDSNSILVTSIDAGDEDSYKSVRGRKGYGKALENLGKYLKAAPNSVVIKYIFTEGNKSLDLIEGFVESIKLFELRDAFFQISFDFKQENIDLGEFVYPLALYSRLYEEGVKFVYFDDLLILRLRSGVTKEQAKQILIGAGLSHSCIAEPTRYKEIVLFGAGDHATALDHKFSLIEKWPIIAVAETGQTNSTAKRFKKFEVQELSLFATSSQEILIAGVQSIPNMYKQAIQLGIDRGRVIRELLI